MAVICTNCGTTNADPGPVDLRLWRCGRCGQPTLVRTSPPAAARPQGDAGAALAVGAVGVALGAAMGGAPGAVIGGILGLIAGGSKK